MLINNHFTYTSYTVLTLLSWQNFCKDTTGNSLKRLYTAFGLKTCNYKYYPEFHKS